MRRLGLWLPFLASLVLPAGAGATDELAAESRPAPMFRLPVYNAAAVGAPMLGLERYVGPDAADQGARVVVLSFMASFCAPCKKELPYLQSLHEKYRDQGLRVMAVSIDTGEEGQKVIQDLIAQHRITFPVLKDRFNLVARRWLGAKSPLPSLFLVRTDGTVTLVHRGYDQDATQFLAGKVEAALRVERGGPPAR